MKSQPVLIIAILVLILLVPAVIYLLLTAESKTDLEPLKKPDKTSAGFDDLHRSVKALDRSISELAVQVGRLGEKIDRQAKVSEGGDPKPIPSQDQSDVKIVELTKAIQSLKEVMRTRPSSSVSRAPLHRTYEKILNRQPQNFKALWTSHEEATKALMFKTYVQVLEKLGPPQSIQPVDSGGVRWSYPKGSVRFFDGFACSAYVLK